jgi:FAD/FMN-containing dehydrogenase
MSRIPHEDKVRRVAAAVSEAVRAGRKVHPVKGNVSHMVPLPGDPRSRTWPVDLSELNEILTIDVAARTCTAEPGVTFGDLVDATLRHGLMPTVVPELDGVTIGGAVAGCSVESMSYKVGGFHDSALEYEIVDGAGTVRTLSPDRDGHLFDMVHGSYGTLALLTRLTFRLIPAKPFVQMTYRTLTTIEAFTEEMVARCRADDFDFVDGIIHGPDRFVLCLGRFVDEAPYVSDYTWLNIYYHSTRERTEDYLKTRDYCFRYDTECHWLTRTFPPLEWKPVRFLIGKWMLGSTNLLKNSKRLQPIFGMKRRPDLVLDVFIPLRNFPDFERWYEQEFDFWPLWVVPYLIPKPYPFLSDDHQARQQDEYSIDCAVYGKPDSDPRRHLSEMLQHKTHELGGMKTLIGRNHYSEDEFWYVYSKDRYGAAKADLDPSGVFPELFTKFGRVE